MKRKSWSDYTRQERWALILTMALVWGLGWWLFVGPHGGLLKVAILGGLSAGAGVLAANLVNRWGDNA